MTSANYCVIRCDDGSFAVEVACPGTPPHMAVGFATEEEASAWIVQDDKLRQAADPFGRPTRRNRRGY